MPTMYTEGSHSVICYDAKIYPNTSIYKKLYPHALEEDGKLIVYKVRYMFENYQDHANLNNLFKEAYTPWSWHEKLFKYANRLGLDYFSTPFHEDAVDFLETLKVPYYKIC